MIKKNIWGRKINPKLNETLNYCESKGNALDLGCGRGANTVFLAKKGFIVTCVDKNKKSLEILKKTVGKKIKVKAIKKDIKDFSFSEKYDLILAISVFHFLEFKRLRPIFKKMKASLNKNGIFFMRVFSNKDELYKKLKKANLEIGKNEIYSLKLNKIIHYFDKKEMMELISGLKVIKIEEFKNKDSHFPVGKHTHYLFDVICKKI